MLLQAALNGARAPAERSALEDTLRLPDGTAAGDNVELLRAARLWISD
jgi:uncharacterized protein (DUF849 family)